LGKHFGSRSSKNYLVEAKEEEQLSRTFSTAHESTIESSAENKDYSRPSSHRSLTEDPSVPNWNKSPTNRDSLGVHVVHVPKEDRRLDIVFVHGLGGTSRLSWSKNKDLAKFWPSTFLPLEPDIYLARISTFGYDANIVHDSSNKSSTVLGFAKELLFELKYVQDENTEELDLGAVRYNVADPTYTTDDRRCQSSSLCTLWEVSLSKK
jgi:hypothetical protein